MANFERNKPGERLDFAGMDLLHPVDLMPPGKYPIAINLRRYIKGAIVGRNLLTNPLYDVIISGTGLINTISRLNDSTPSGPLSGYAVIISGGKEIFVNTNPSIATGMSGNPVSMLAFRPNASVKPYLYIGDVAPGPNVTEAENDIVSLSTTSLYSGDPVTFLSNRMTKVNSTGTIYKMGVKEPQVAPIVTTENGNFTVSGNLLATAIPWTNFGGANPDFDYGETNGFPHPISGRDGTIWFAVDVQNANFVTINTLTGSATINGGTTTPTSLGPSTSVNTNPGHYIQVPGSGGIPATATVVTGAFVDASGNVMPIGVAPLFVSSVVDVGSVIGVANGITVPFGAVSFQIGINSTGNTFSSNSGSFAIDLTVTTNSLPSVLSIIGNLTCPFWQDSPTSGPVASYLWKNPGDPGGGTSRTISNAVGTVSGNSFYFDTTFTAGVPGLPGIGNGNTPMQWFQLNPDEVVTGSIPISPTQTANFNFCLYGKIYVPAAGNYTFILTAKDAMMWGIEGCTYISQTPLAGHNVALSQFGQTITVVNGYPLLPTILELSGEDGFVASIEVVVNFAAAGTYGIEIDYDYWFHAGRTLFLLGSPTPGASPGIIPPTSSSVREEVQYRGVYRSSATGAQSNPSPESPAITLPVTSNTILMPWSNDPQVDLWDCYRLDSATSSFTYVATGQNDALGGTIGGVIYNTPIVDALTDTELGTQLLDFDNFEPFPSIDLPQKGTCTVSGGVITWVSGGSTGGTATGFNTRWLAGTIIIIGSPTGLAYVLTARPTSTTTMEIDGVPDEGSPVLYTISEPILAAQPLPYLFGPTDNINFAYGVGDPLRPGTLYWCAGSNLDSAPDTNQQDVTDPDEPLVNGAIAGGLGVLFSIKRAWLIMPNFFNATATATGTTGSTWSLQESSITRGLYMPRCVCVTGGGLIFFRVDDGIHVSEHGAASQSITDEDLYPLFPHETPGSGTSSPKPVTIAGYTIYPPNDSLPQGQRLSADKSYVYYDYLDATSTPRTLVYDLAAKGWVYDVYTPAVTIHATDEGQSVQGTLVGCSDGTVRLLSSAGTEAATAVLLTPAFDKGDTRASAKFGDLYIESTNP